MTTHVVADDLLGRVARKQWELNRRILEGSLDPAYAAVALQEVIEGRFALRDRFSRYADKLLTLPQQLERLRWYNQVYWENRLTAAQLSTVETESTRVQSVKDLEILHVEFGSLEETVEMWWRVYIGEQPGHRRNNELRLDLEHFWLLDSNVQTYEPGIHVVRLNLVAHWEPGNGRTLREVRKNAADSGQILAHTEVISAYGLHSVLFREQNGTDLPYADLPGTDVMYPGDSGPHVLYMRWDPFVRKAELSAGWVGGRTDKWAAPVIIRRL